MHQDDTPLTHGKPWVPPSGPTEDALQNRQLWTSVLVLHHRVIVRTVAGGAKYLALKLDGAKLPGALGTIAGNDSLVLICDSPESAITLVDTLGTMFGPEAGPTA